MFCKDDFFECKEWLNGGRCKAQIEKRKPIECFINQHWLIVFDFKQAQNNYEFVGTEQEAETEIIKSGAAQKWLLSTDSGDVFC